MVRIKKHPLMVAAQTTEPWDIPTVLTASLHFIPWLPTGLFFTSATVFRREFARPNNTKERP
ncbi:hypothetical protein M2103_001915 [Ereboglobus sp. PH5-5]|nr:hypothetical protein [Ereboglobus sp. PH5-5]